MFALHVSANQRFIQYKHMIIKIVNKMNSNNKMSPWTWRVELGVFAVVSVCTGGWNRDLWENMNTHTHTGSRWGPWPSQTGRIPVRRSVLIRASQRCAAVWAPSLRIQTRRGQDLAVFVQRRDRCHRGRLTARHNWLRNDNKHSRSVVPANLLVFSQSWSLADNTGRLTRSVFRFSSVRVIFHITCWRPHQNLTRSSRARSGPRFCFNSFLSSALNCFAWPS